MAINPAHIGGFATTGEQAKQSGEVSDIEFALLEGPAEVTGVGDVKAGNIRVKRDALKGLDFLDSEADKEEVDEGAQDPLTKLRRTMAAMSSTPASLVDVTSDLRDAGDGYSANWRAGVDAFKSIAIPTSMGLISGAGAILSEKAKEDSYFTDISNLSDVAKGSDGAEIQHAAAGAETVAKGVDWLAEQDWIHSDIKNINKPITSVGGYKLPGYDPKVASSKYGSYQEYAQSSTASPTLAGQIGGTAMAVTSAYSAYDALKGGIDSPMEGAQAVSGIIGTIGGLNAMGLISTPGFMAAAGPIGWGITAATFLYQSGLIGGKGKDKVPMGGVEFRLVDDAGNQFARPEEGKDRKIKAVNAHSYNGFNSSALASQANKQVDYLYGFADHFDLEVNEDVWADAAFGSNNTPIYMPRGREAPYRSVLERIDSEGDGSLSPTEWLRHALEYQSPDGRRIIDGDIYKGVRIGPNGLPMKVGYKTQEDFQEEVAKFNKQFYA